MLELKEFVKENKNLAQFELLQCIYYELHKLNMTFKEYITNNKKVETKTINLDQKPKPQKRKRNVKKK